MGMNFSVMDTFPLEICKIFHRHFKDFQKGGRISFQHQVMLDRRQAAQKPKNPEAAICMTTQDQTENNTEVSNLSLQCWNLVKAGNPF